MKREIVDLIVTSSRMVGGKKSLSCAAAFRISQKHGVTPRAIGRICDENQIKITSCQLGCFGAKKRS